MALSLEERAKRRLVRQLAKERWANAHKGWRAYSKNLEAAAKMVGQIIKAHLPALESGEAGWQLALQKMTAALERYSRALDPWAYSVAHLMLTEVDRRERKAWLEHGREIGRNLIKEIENAPTGKAYQEGMARQVALITSLPLTAAQRVHELATGQLYSGLRGKSLLEEILKTGSVTVSRAKLIARTEVARASTEFTRARAEYVGSPGYIWRTARDVDVRKSHKKLEGTVHRWDAPPLSDPPNLHAHPGQSYNCFPGDTLIDLSCGLRRLWRAPFDGELICLKLSSEIIEVTPNHPILTAKGWKAASALDPGDYLRRIPSQRFETTDFSKNKRIPTFNDLYTALICSSGVCNRLRGLNFHGDVINDDIDEIIVDLDLLEHVKFLLSKKFGQFNFNRTDGRISTSCLRSLNHIICSNFSGFLYSLVTLFLSFIKSDDLISFLNRPNWDIISRKNISNNSYIDIISFAKNRCSGTGLIKSDNFLFWKDFAIVGGASFDFSKICEQPAAFEMDAQLIGRTSDRFSGFFQESPIEQHFCRLLDKGTRKFSGHVYTIESDTGYYGTGVTRIIAKNCRCYPEVIVPDVDDVDIPNFGKK